jgi:hypothetical protein
VSLLYLGATYTNAQNFFDATGALVDPTTVTVTIVRPDLTTVPVTPANVSVGDWLATYIPTQVGHHLINWTGLTTVPATTSWALSDEFTTIANYYVLAAGDLATYLGVTFTDGGARATQILLLAQQLCESIVKPLPDGAQGVVLGVAARAYSNPTNAQQETTGPFSVGFGVMGGGLWLTRSDKATLRRLAGSGGAFTIDTMPSTAGANLAWWDLNGLSLDWSTENASSDGSMT